MWAMELGSSPHAVLDELCISHERKNVETSGESTVVYGGVYACARTSDPVSGDVILADAREVFDVVRTVLVQLCYVTNVKPVDSHLRPNRQ